MVMVIADTNCTVRQPTFESYEHLPSPTSADNRISDFSNQSVDGWLSLIREELYANHSVEDIFFSTEDNIVDVWVVIPERDLAVLHQIVEVEGQILEKLVSGKHPALFIDFHVIYRCGRDVVELAPTRAIKLPR